MNLIYSGLLTAVKNSFFVIGLLYIYGFIILTGCGPVTDDNLEYKREVDSRWYDSAQVFNNYFIGQQEIYSEVLASKIAYPDSNFVLPDLNSAKKMAGPSRSEEFKMAAVALLSFYDSVYRLIDTSELKLHIAASKLVPKKDSLSKDQSFYFLPFEKREAYLDQKFKDAHYLFIGWIE